RLRRQVCPTCTTGYFVVSNCSISTGRGVQCEPCTNCSASHLETRVQCSAFADSLCVNRTTPAPPPRSAEAP
ncbi:Tumor necrosis factor receptor superfamily member 4, partial [Dissostichus eleginoides]